MELVYNELSSLPLSENDVEAGKRLIQFIYTYIEARKHGFTKIRFSKYIHEIELALGYTIQKWVVETKQKTLKDILLAAIVHPFIKEEDSWAEDRYISNTYILNEDHGEIVNLVCVGLAAAHIYGTLSISFSGSPIWERNIISASKQEIEGANELVVIANVFSKECFDKPEIKQFIENSGKLILVETTMPFKDKPIHLRDDHGNDILYAFAERLRNSPYVIAVINSLPWNRKAINFIRRTYPNGLIELVLVWEDRGLGLVIQTTGRNLHETIEIARRLEQTYGN